MSQSDLERLRIDLAKERQHIIRDTHEKMRKAWWRRLFRVEVTLEDAEREADSAPARGSMRSRLGWADYIHREYCELPLGLVHYVEAYRARHPKSSAYRDPRSADPAPTLTMTLSDYRIMAYRINDPRA